MTDNKTGIELIAEERQRQTEVENFDLQHDEDYKHGELVGASMCYAAEYVNKNFPENEKVLRAQIFVSYLQDWEDAWPWSDEWDKRKKHNQLRCLVISGALIAAEIDRLQNLPNE